MDCKVISLVNFLLTIYRGCSILKVFTVWVNMTTLIFYLYREVNLVAVKDTDTLAKATVICHWFLFYKISGDHNCCWVTTGRMNTYFLSFQIWMPVILYWVMILEVKKLSAVIYDHCPNIQFIFFFWLVPWFNSFQLILKWFEMTDFNLVLFVPFLCFPGHFTTT